MGGPPAFKVTIGNQRWSFARQTSEPEIKPVSRIIPLAIASPNYRAGQSTPYGFSGNSERDDY